MSMKLDLKQFIAHIPDFPKKGILFYDISPLLASAEAWRQTIMEITEKIKIMNPDVIVGLESRGFLVSAAVAIMLNKGFVMIRKKNKLPGEVISYTYDLEYGSDTLEIQKDAIKPGQTVLILDDILATGGTINASCDLLNSIGAKTLGAICIMELSELKGKENLKVPVETIITM